MQDRLPQLHETLLQRTAGPYIRVNRVDPAMSVTCPLYPQLLPSWCGAAKRRDVPTTDIASILMIAGASYIAWGVIDRTAGELTVS